MILREVRPKTIQEAIEIIAGGLNGEELQFIRTHTPSEVHHTVGRHIRNDWGLWVEKTPLVQNFKKRFKLFGHGDDVSGIILEGVWADVTGGDVDSKLNDTAERFRNHWLHIGVNPETGEAIEGFDRSKPITIKLELPIKSQTIAEKYNWAKENIEFDVEETRKLAASHGKDGIIIIAWTDNGDGTVSYNTTTAGKKRSFAMQAAAVRDWLMTMLGGSDNKPVTVEDRINEHTD